MQFDVAALRQFLTTHASPIATLAAAGGATLAILIAFGAIWAYWPVSDDVPAETVAVSGPVFKPVVMTSPAAAPAEGADEYRQPVTTRYDDLQRQDDRSLTRAVQQELKRAGCYGGPVNGVWNAATRQGMGEFTGLVNARLPVDHPDPILLVLLETHDKVICSTGGAPRPAPSTQRGEVAGAADERPAERRAAEVSKAPTRVTVAEEEESDTSVPAATAVAAGGAAAVTAAAVAPGQKSALEEPVAGEPKKTRKYRQPSLSRQVSKGFKSIQRSLNKIFW
jgi:hypothetical protein